MTALEERIADIDRSLSFQRQALHDLSRFLISCRETVSENRRQSVTVVVTTCDRPLQLERALFSLACQTRPPDIVAVVNDGRESVREIVDRFSDRQTIFLLRTKRPYSGPSAARNIALDALDTEFIAFLDDDNLMWPRWIERALSFFEADPLIDLMYGAQLRDSELSTVEKNWFLVAFDLEKLKKGNFIDLNQVMHRKSNVRFDENLKRLVDWDYLLSFAERSPDRICAVNAISSIYSTSGVDRISVACWPPDLAEVIAHRRRGEKMRLHAEHRVCSCCGRIAKFDPGPGGRERAQCPDCASLERHRFLRLTAPLLQRFWIPPTRDQASTTMIEIAPSHATLPLRRMFGTALTIDAAPAADGRTVDIAASLTDLPIAAETIDVAVVLHVLEHIPDDRKAMAEVGRVLMPNGVAILQVPLSGRAKTDEEVLESAQQRAARYGQADHVRIYGDDFFARLAAAGLKWISISPRQSMPPETIEKYGLLPDEALVFVVRSNSVAATERLEIFGSMLRKGSLQEQSTCPPPSPAAPS